MVFVCLVTLQDHIIKALYYLKRKEPLKVSNHPAKFVGHEHCDKRDIMFIFAEEEDARCPRFNPPLLFVSKGHGFKAHSTDPRYTRS